MEIFVSKVQSEPHKIIAQIFWQQLSFGLHESHLYIIPRTT